MNKFEVLDEKQLVTVTGGKKVDWVKCYVGSAGFALTGLAAGGALGYWGGVATGYATFCR